MPNQELFSSQLEMVIQNGRAATVSMHVVGILAAMLLFMPYLPLITMLLGAVLFLAFLLLRSLIMSSALIERKYQSHPRRVFWQLMTGAALTGAVWSGLYIFATFHVPVTMQHIFLLLIVMIMAFSLGYSAAIREYFLAYVFTSLWPIAWWTLINYEGQPYNLVIGLSLLAFCALLMHVCNQLYQSFYNMLSLNWEREHIAQELGDLTGSLRDRNRQLRGARKQLTQLANVDELTGLGNRRFVNRVLHEEINRARRTGAELSVVMLDVDYFKNYNDTYGHPAGDLVLQKLADVMQRALTRAGEVVARYGGEEFILILPGASAESAMRTATRLREMVVEEQIPHKASGAAEVITISQGIFTAQPEDQYEPEQLVKQADLALYRAKGAGRDAIAVG